MTRLVLINGAPGSGKSTIAQALAQDRAMTLALDVDGIKHSLGRWEEDPLASGLHARRLTLALAGEQLQAGFDVVIGQYLPEPSSSRTLSGWRSDTGRASASSFSISMLTPLRTVLANEPIIQTVSSTQSTTG